MEAAAAAAALPIPLVKEDPVLRRYDDCLTRPGLIVVAAALALEDGGEPDPPPLPLLLVADAFWRRYEDRLTRPGATSVAVEELPPVAVFAVGGEAAAASSRGSFEAQGGEAFAERGDLAAGEPGREPAFLFLERGEDDAVAAAFRASREDTVCGDDGPLCLVAAAGDDDGDTASLMVDTGAEGDGPGAAREEAAGETTTAAAGEASASAAAAATGAGVGAAEEATSDTTGFVFSARAAAREATRDGDGAPPLGDRVGEPAALPAAARAEARVMAGRAAGNADGLGSTRTDGDAGAAGSAAAAEAVAAADRVPP